VTSPTKGPAAEDPDDHRGNAVDAGTSGLEAGSDVADSGGCGSCDACDGPDCGCDFLLFLRLSTVLLLVAAVLPAVGADHLVGALIRGYQRWLSRFTPACPSTVSCSAYALAAVHRLGARRGLAAAAHRVERCGEVAANAP